MFLLMSFFAVSLGVLPLSADNPSSVPNPGTNTSANDTIYGKFFPSIFFKAYMDTMNAQQAKLPYTVPTEDEATSNAQYWEQKRSMLLNNDILAFYGHPNSVNMGILGRFTKEELLAKLKTLAAEYEQTENGKHVILAFYLIYGTVWPKGEIGIMSDALAQEWIDFAAEHDMLVFLDHQIGKYTPLQALDAMLPFLKNPNVHLALDPEWRTTKPMVEFGQVSGDEINNVNKAMERYMITNDIPGERFLVIHQFHTNMISNRAKIADNSERIRLVHCMDGIGRPQLKKDTYAFNALARNLPVKSFKLFYNFEIPGAGYDKPILLPEEVLKLNPRPYIIMYQ
ncbi:hypothetical protein ACYULU_00520 [Breznakiellaceae bacterium SP9]